MPGQLALRSFRPFSPDGLHLLANAIRRSTESSSPVVLSEGAIIGIAVASGLAFFSALAFIIICCIRKRHRDKRRTSTRRIDLGDDDELFPVDMAAQESHLPLGTSVLANPSSDESDPKNKEWHNITQRKSSPEKEKGKLIPPAYSFHVTGIRDSWPLVAWTTTPEIGAIDDANISPAVATRNPEGPSSVAPSDPYHCPQATPYPQPQAFHVRPIQHHGAPIQAKHSRQTSRSSLASTNTLKRKSSTDNQLTTILRSTSQRLRDAQAAGKVEQPQPKARGMRESLLAPISGLPPSEKAPSPQRDQISGWNRQSLVVTPASPGDSCCNSIKSSVLDLFSPRGNASPRANTSPIRNPLIDKAARDTTEPENPSDDDADSLYSGTLDVAAVPAALTSPSRRGNKTTAEKRPSRVSTTEDTGTKIHEDNRASLAPFGARGNFTTRTKFAQTKSLRTKDRKVRQVPSGDDPFVTKGSDATNTTLPLVIRRPRKTTFGEEFTLRAVSGNVQGPIPEPTKATPRNSLIGAAATQPPNPFLFTTCPPDFAMPGPSHVTASDQAKTAKGHKRSSITRVTSLPPTQRNSGIPIVPEEPETTKAPPSARPPSIKTFSPVITAVPHARGRETLPARSHLSYSATLSLYECYGPDALGTPLASPPPSPATSPKRSSPNRYRHRASFSSLSSDQNPQHPQHPPGSPSLARPVSRHDSIDSSRRSSLARTAPAGVSFVIPAAQIAREAELHQLQQQQHAAALSAFGLVGPPPSKRRSGGVRGPRAQPPLHQPHSQPQQHSQTLAEPRESVQYSVGLLRRMNSVTASTPGEGNTPLILPAYRSGGWGDGRYLAPATRGRWSGAGGAGGSGEWREGGTVMPPGTPREQLYEGAPGGNALGLWARPAQVPRQSWMVVEEEGATAGAGSRPARCNSKRATVPQRLGSGDAEAGGGMLRPAPLRYGPRGSWGVRPLGGRESLYDENGFLVHTPMMV